MTVSIFLKNSFFELLSTLNVANLMMYSIQGKKAMRIWYHVSDMSTAVWCMYAYVLATSDESQQTSFSKME